MRCRPKSIRDCPRRTQAPDFRSPEDCRRWHLGSANIERPGNTCRAPALLTERTGEGRKRAMAAGVKFGRKPKLSAFQRAEAIKRRAAGETLASIARSYAVDISMISRLEA